MLRLPLLSLVAAAAALLLSVGASAAQEYQPPSQTSRAPSSSEIEFHKDLQRWAEQYVNSSAVPGVSVAVAYPGGRVFTAAAGQADLERKVDLTPDHRLMSGSIGKTYFAALFLDLVREGKMSPDDLLSKYLGEEEWFDRLPNGSAITMLSLFRHTSGVSEHVQLPEFWQAAKAEPNRRWQQAELLEFILDKDPLFAVDEGWSYADTNYILAGMAMEKVLPDSAYREVFRRFLQPHKLLNTLPNTTPDLPGLSQGYHILGEPGWTEWKPVLTGGKFYINPQLEWCGGGYYSTTGDLARWGALLFGDKLLPAASRELALKHAVDAPLAPGGRYGIGVIVSETPHGPGWGHSGWFPGYLSEMIYLPELKCCIAVQVNTDHIRRVGNPRGNLMAVAELVAKRWPPKEAK